MRSRSSAVRSRRSAVRSRSSAERSRSSASVSGSAAAGCRWSLGLLAPPIYTCLETDWGCPAAVGNSEYVRGRLPLQESLRDELGALLLAPAVQHLKV